MFLKLSMKHQEEELYKVYINHDPGMTLTYFMARSAEVAYPRSQVSLYRTICPLVVSYSYWLKECIESTSTFVSIWTHGRFSE